MADTTVADTSSTRYTGRVKWFNNKAGYGFVTVTDGPKSGSDIFVHHSSISVHDEQYKYLVQGEYVEFSISSTNGGQHEFQASSVSGIKGGKLMCETRRDVRTSRAQYREQTAEPVKAQVKTPRAKAAPKTNANPKEEKGEWVQVAKKGKADAAPKKAAPKKPAAKKEKAEAK